MRDLDVTETLPSLYLNAGKCYEDLGDFDSAREHYQAALSHLHFLPADGYGKMIKAGVHNGIARISDQGHTTL